MSEKVFIGYDTREDIAYQVCKSSILRHTQSNIDVEPLVQRDLRERGYYWRDHDKLSSTEFTFTRFLIPELMNFQGWALFMDCDMILQDDIQKLFDQKDESKAIMCAQHDYTPKEGTKMDGQQQTVYPRKNWSSVMLINCGHPSNKNLTMDVVNDPETGGKYLHRFMWLEDDENDVGEISHEWNWLVGWYKEPEDGYPRLIHHTEGGPWFKDYRFCEYHKEWKAELFYMMHSDHDMSK